MPAWCNLRGWALRAAISAVIATGMTIGAIGGTAEVSAEPPNLGPAPAAVPEAIDAAVPAPPVKRLHRIPARSVTPGASHELQELREAVMPSPSGDRFFDQWPADLARRAAGDVIATRDVMRTAQLLMTVPLQSARQIKFRSVDAGDQPIFGTATLLVPAKAWKGPRSRPVLVHNSPIVALGTKCTPGYTLAHGYHADTNTTDLIPPFAQLALDRGYAVIMSDHTGPRMAYAEPYVAAHVIMDSLRAAGRLDSDNFATGPIAMHGYSGGAIATNAAAKLADSYAPEQAGRIVGAAYGGVPADYRSLAGAMNANLGSGVFHAAMLGVARERPEVLAMANNAARWLATSPMRDLCTSGMGVLGVSHIPTQVLSADPDPYHSPVAERLFAITSMKDHRATMPLRIYHGTYEWWIPASQARALFAEQCALRASASYREYPAEHMTGIFAGLPDTLTWLDDRLRGKPARSECR
ncbi:lipase family protein [Gordonia sp. IITR100]|uniref:lipase family protein n=1 Tax=Gordonia sp. IITR100 TaxID=1314686 RepID=UPI000990E09B|nr:lipase family protein [Gordonia sp. IITR100]